MNDFIGRFKKELKDNGQSMAWFWRTKLKDHLTHGNFRQQINKHSTMQEPVETAIAKFLKRREEC